MAGAQVTSQIEKILRDLGLATLSQNFIHSKVNTLEVAKKLTEKDLASLGIVTIGDRIRFKERLEKESTNGLEMASTVTAGRSDVRLIFGRQSDRKTNKRRKKIKTWTGTFVCLADREQSKAPTLEERTVLFKAGLGFKRLSCNLELNTADFQEFLMEESNYPKLRNAGGFEFLRCGQNCRNLQVIACSWTPKDFRSHVGTQIKIYLRPIQHNLSLLPVISEDDELIIDEKCSNCGQLFNIRELRLHVENCYIQAAPISDFESRDEGENVDHVHRTDELSDIADNGVGINETDVNMPDNMSANDLEAEWEAMNDIPNDSLTSNQVEEMIHYINQNLTDPVTILKYVQSRIVLGRALEITDPSAPSEGITNLIMVDRYNILETGLDEIKRIENLRYTLEVDYYGERAKDLGGPRKEFLQDILHAIQESYLANIRDFSVEDYEGVGKVIALSLLQNGRIPVFQEDVLREIFVSESPRPAIVHLRKGLDCLGIYQIGKQVPIFLHLFTPRNIRLTWRKVLSLLEPEFHDPGSNARKFENMVYKLFVDYVRDVGSGRRERLSLNDVVKFATGTEEEPILGFALHPSILFVEAGSFIPTANTCINRLNLPRPSVSISLPSKDELFNLYDYAFLNAFYGMQ